MKSTLRADSLEEERWETIWFPVSKTWIINEPVECSRELWLNRMYVTDWSQAIKTVLLQQIDKPQKKNAFMYSKKKKEEVPNRFYFQQRYTVTWLVMMGTSYWSFTCTELEEWLPFWARLVHSMITTRLYVLSLWHKASDCVPTFHGLIC